MNFLSKFAGARFALTIVLLVASCSGPAPEGSPEAAEPGAEAPPAEAGATASPEPAAPAPESPASRAPAPAPRDERPAPAPAPAPRGEAPAPAVPQTVEVEIPSGTVLGIELLTALDSSVNRVGDKVQARTLSPLYVDGKQVLGSGALVEGRVTEVQSAGRVKGRAKLGLTFDRLATETGSVSIRTSFVEQEAEDGRKKDAAIIGGAAGVGAIVGGIIGGKRGAAIGAGIGGAGGTGVVLGTKGEEIRLPVGTEMSVRLDDPVAVELH